MVQQDMWYAYHVYREKSFSKAAEKLFVTQPTLSIAIKRIEKNLGQPIFDRTRPNIQLTEAGRIYFQMAERILELEEDLVKQVEDVSTLQTGTLRIGGTHYINTVFLPPVLREFAKCYPRVNIELLEASSDTMEELLLSNRADLVFKEGKMEDVRFSVTPAFRDEILLAVPLEQTVNTQLASSRMSAAMVMEDVHKNPNHPCVPLSYFSDENFILLKKKNNLRFRSEEICAEEDFVPQITMEIDQLVTAYYLVECGLGVSFVSDCLVKRIALDLYYYKLDSKQTQRYFSAVTLKNRYMPVAVQRFIHMMREKYANA